MQTHGSLSQASSELEKCNNCQDQQIQCDKGNACVGSTEKRGSGKIELRLIGTLK